MSDPAIVAAIGDGLRRMRLRKNITQEQLAETSGLNRVTISRLESGRAATLLTVVQVLRALGELDMLRVFFREDELSPMQLLELKRKERHRASHPRRAGDSSKGQSEW